MIKQSNHITWSATLVLLLLIGGGHARGDFTFGTPTNLGPAVNSRYWDHDPCISADGIVLFFGSARTGGSGDADLWVATRKTIDDPWGEPVNLGPTVNTEHAEADPSISTDGLSLFFRSYRPGGYGRTDLWVTTRATRDSEWGTPVNLGPGVNTAYDEGDPSISADGLSLYFCDYGYPETAPRPGGYGGGDIWVTTRRTPSDPWGEPVNLGPVVNTAANEYAPSLSADGRMLLFDSERPGGLGQFDLWVAARKTQDDPWGEPVNLGPNVNGLGDERDPSVSADGSTLYFGSDRPGGNGHWDIWQVSLEPIVDLNSDGIVDSANTCVTVDYWGTDGGGGAWHRIGFVRDGLFRSLYGDDTLIAEDTQQGLRSSVGSLNIGCGIDSAAGTFWSGLIDDIRIYNRAVTP